MLTCIIFINVIFNELIHNYFEHFSLFISNKVNIKSYNSYTHPLSEILIFVICCRVTDHPRTQWLKNNKYLLSHSFCWSGIQEQLSWGILSLTSWQARPQLPSLEGLTGAGESASRKAHSLAVGKRPQCLLL